jgi:hypothetical protein
MVQAERRASEAAQNVEVRGFSRQRQSSRGKRRLAIESGAAHGGAEQEVGYGFHVFS